MGDDDSDLGTSEDNLLDDSLDDSFGGDAWGNESHSPIDKHASLLKELTNFKPIIQRRFHNWLGLEFDNDKQEFTKQRHAIMNERGAWWAIGFLQTYQCETNIITNISQHEFNNLQLDMIDVAWRDFGVHDDFGIKCLADWSKICTELQTAAFLVLAGAGDGKYTKFLGESVSRTETINMSQPQGNRPRIRGQPGMLGKLKNTLLGRK